MSITQTISQFPEPLPDRDNDTPQEFSDHVDQFLGHINTHVTEVNQFAVECNNTQSAINTSEANCAQHEANAASYATQAAQYKQEIYNAISDWTSNSSDGRRYEWGLWPGTTSVNVGALPSEPATCVCFDRDDPGYVDTLAYDDASAYYDGANVQQVTPSLNGDYMNGYTVTLPSAGSGVQSRLLVITI